MKHVNKILAGLITCCVILLFSGCNPRQGEKHDFSIGKGTFLLDGKPFVIKAAEIHYTRIPAEYWQHRIQMCKALGMNTICIYAFWNIHEQKPGEFDFKGQNDMVNVRRSAYAGSHLILAMAVVLLSIVFLLRNQVGGWFTDSVEVSAMVSSLFLPFLVYQFGDGLQISFANALRGIADVKPMMFIAFISYFVISLPVGYLCGFVLGWGTVGVWMAFPFGLTSAGIMLWLRFRYKTKDK